MIEKSKEHCISEIDDLIKNAKQEDSTVTNTPAKVEVNLNNGVYTASTANLGTTTGTVAGEKATSGKVNVADTGKFVGVTQMTITANRYGADNNVTINIKFDADPGEEELDELTAQKYKADGSLDTTGMATFDLKLATGVEYTEGDIEKLLAKAGFSATVEFNGPNPDEANTLFVTDNTKTATATLTGGKGLGDTDAFLGQKDYAVQAGGEGMTLQVGANEGQTISFGISDMSAVALGVDGTKVDVSTQVGAQNSIEAIDAGIAAVSKQRSLLGAIQNRLEHTISNLDNTAENLQAAESGIRDVDMAAEMVQFSKNNILQQAAQSMLAQANQANQGVLSLLG